MRCMGMPLRSCATCARVRVVSCARAVRTVVLSSSTFQIADLRGEISARLEVERREVRSESAEAA